MENSSQDKINAFDTLFTNPQIQKLKILLPCFTPSVQLKMAVWIKFLEFRYTLQFLKENKQFASGIYLTQNMPDLSVLCTELAPYSSREEKKQLQQFSDMIQSLNNCKEMMEMVQTMKDIFPEGENPFDGNMDMSQMMNLFRVLNV